MRTKDIAGKFVGLVLATSGAKYNSIILIITAINS